MKIPNYLFVFMAILLFLTTSHIAVAYKYFQILVHHGLYYCQEMVKSLNFQIPGIYAKVLAGILLFALMITVIKVLNSLVKVFAFRKSLLSAKKADDRELSVLVNSLGLQEKVIVFEQEKPQAFCFGILNPKIYISTTLVKLMDHDELKIILRHEKYHLEHKDTLALFLASIIESLFPLFPVVSDFIRVYRIDREVKADTSATTLISDKQILKNVLKKLIRFEPHIQPAFLPAILNSDTLEARIRSINVVGAHYRKVRSGSLLFSTVSFAVLLGLIVTPVNAIEIHEDGQDVVMLCNGSSACEMVCRKETLQLLQSIQSQYTPVTTNFSSIR